MSNKLRYALSASFSVALAYLFPLYFGIDDTASAAITVMVISASDSLSSSLSKGIYRVLGTIAGAVFGVVLIALFPQDRFLYLFVLSIGVTFVLYLARAYRGDKTIFLLTAMTMMIVFDGGRVDDIFLYATNKVLMTIMGIVIYTFVSVYIFPLKQTQKTKQKEGYFLWFVPEDIKGAFVAFLIFWFSVCIWIYFAIPYGYLVVTLATSISLFSVYSIAKGYQLLIIYSLSFIVAIFSYIFILPNIEGWWSLGIFLFVYSFFGFYFIKQEIVIFYLLGMATFLIENEMSFSFEIFMFVLLIFYLFLFVLLFFDYFPFNQKSEHMFLVYKDRFLKQFQNKKDKKYLNETLNMMMFYASKINYSYFDIKKESVLNFCNDLQNALKTNDIKKVYNNDIDFNKLKESRF
jgi:hypothetical protein